MTTPESLTKDQLLALLAQREQLLVQRDEQLQQRDQLLRQHEQQLREQDIGLQTKDLEIQSLIQERDELQAAYNKLLEHRFRNRSERYIEDPAQLQLEFGNTPEAEDAANGLADAVEDLETVTVPEHVRQRKRRRRNEQLPAHLPV